MVLVPVVLRLVVVVLPCSCWPFLDSAAAEVVVEQILPACLEEAVGNLGQVVAVVLVEAESYLRQVEAEEGNRLDQVVEGSGSLNYCRRALRRCNADGKAPKTAMATVMVVTVGGFGKHKKTAFGTVCSVRESNVQE